MVLAGNRVCTEKCGSDMDKGKIMPADEDKCADVLSPIVNNSMASYQDRKEVMHEVDHLGQNVRVLHRRRASDGESLDSSSYACFEPQSTELGLTINGDDLSEISEVCSFVVGEECQEELWSEDLSDNSEAEYPRFSNDYPNVTMTNEDAAKLLLYQEALHDQDNAGGMKADVDPRTQARLEALLEAAGLGKLSSTTNDKAFADPEVLRKLTSSVSCALDEAAAALTRMRAEQHNQTNSDARSLVEACSEGDTEAVKRLLSEGRSVHETTDDGESLLSLACSAGYYELAEVLLRMRANVEDRGIKGDCTPLMDAASGGFADIVRLLIAYDADVNAQTSAGHTALHHAAVGGYEDVVRILIDAGANVEEQNENGHTPLMEAASAGHVGVAKILLEAGAGINTHSNEFKESALTLACYKGHLDMVKFLLDAGADQEHKTDEMHTALMEASMDGHVEVARLLLDSGAQVNMPADSFESPLTLAACGGHVELANLLIERGANLEEVNDEGYTPLMEAAREGHEEMVALLIAHGADVNAQTEETQETALTLACCGGFLEVAHFLIRANADIELGCSTPLMEAAQEGHVELVKYLIKQGAHVQAVTGTGDTALTYACENGHTDVADVLLQAGAELEHESEGGRTPLMKAARAGHLCTAQFLISKGASVNRATTNNDHTVLSLACAGGHHSVVELLLEQGADPMHKLKDGSTMLIEAAKGGHTNVVNLLLDYPNGLHKRSSITMATDFGDSIPMADNMPPDSILPKDISSTESLASRLEQFIAKMMSQAENVSGTREEQMERKKEILEELQRVEQELKCRTQQASLSSHVREGLATPTDEEIIIQEAELLQRQQAILEQQRHEQQLQQQKEYYQTRLQATNNASGVELNEHAPKRQPIPLHIALQNHLQAHHVQDGSFEELKRSLDNWDTRDRNMAMPAQVKPMPAFNFNGRHDEDLPECVSSIPLRLEELPFAEAPPSRSLADALATLIQGNDSRGQRGSEPSRAEVSNMQTHEKPMSQLESESEKTKQTLEWLETVDKSFAPRKMVKAESKSYGKHDFKKVPLLPNGLVEPRTASVTQQTDGSLHHLDIPSPKRSNSPPRVPCVDPNAETDSNHDTALTLACAGGHAELVKLLLSRHAVIEHRDKKGFTPLILASTAGHAEVVEILIEHGADIEAQSERTKDTPLSLACSGGRYEVVDILLRLSANKEHRNVSDYTPLSLAASGGYVNIIKLLLHHGAEINSRTGSKLGISPLMLAAMNGHTAAVKLLLDMGSDINAQIETNRNTALTLACFQGRHDVVSLLVDRKANIEHRAKTGLTPLMEAASGGYVEVGRVLLDKGADVNAPPVPSSKDTALTIAADKGHYRFVELLLSRGAAVDVKNKKGNSPLWLACNGGHLDVVQLLVDNGADIDSQDNRKVSCLMTAFRKGHVKVVKWLVRHVTQFPSDQECGRYISTVSDKEMLKKCQQCIEIIVQAKECQAREALKNASILLEQIESEKSREERRKEAAARKREKKKQKRKEKQTEIPPDRQDTPTSQKEERSSSQDDDDDEPGLPLPSIKDTKPSSHVVVSSAQEHGQVLEINRGLDRIKAGSPLQTERRDYAIRTEKSTSSNNKQPNQKVIATEASFNSLLKEDVVGEEENSVPTNQKNRRQKRKTGQPPKSSKQPVENGFPADKQPSVTNNSKLSACSTRVADLDDFGDVPVVGKQGVNAAKQTSNNKRTSSSVNQLDGFDGNSSKYISPSKGAGKAGATPSPGKKKRDEGWKEVVRKSKKLAIPANAVGKLARSLGTINELSGANLEFEKPDKRSSERTLVIKGSAEATKHAHSLVATLLREKDSEVLNGKTTAPALQAVPSLVGGPLTHQTDTMSSIGIFSIADFIVTTQICVPTETKPKMAQSKPGWPVRPALQPAWGAPAQTSTITQSTSVTPAAPSSPRSANVILHRGPVVATPAKSPSDVSRQLFPDGRANATPVLRPVIQQRLPLPQTSTQQSPPQGFSMPQPLSQPALNPYAGSTAFQKLGFKDAPKLASAPTKQLPLGHPEYSPFDNQLSQSLPKSLLNDINPGKPDPAKAPGFRPTSMSFVNLSHSQSSIDEVGLFKTHSNRSLGNSFAAPYSSISVNTSVHSLFTNATTAQDIASVVSSSGLLETTQYSPRTALAAKSERDHYTTPYQPMTLPRISSSLNPNASEFTSSRLSGSDDPVQHSPAHGVSIQQMSPVQFRPSPPTSAYQMLPSQQRNAQVTEQEAMMRHLVFGAVPTQQAPGQVPLLQQTSQVPLAVRAYSPATRPMSTPPNIDPMLGKSGEDSITSQSPRDSTEDRRPPRPIGGERFTRKPAFPSSAVASDIWSIKHPDAEWPVSVGPPPLLEQSIPNTLFKVEGVAYPSMPQYPFYPTIAGPAGDAMTNAWHTSPGKYPMMTQEWAPGWTQPHSSG